MSLKASKLSEKVARVDSNTSSETIHAGGMVSVEAMYTLLNKMWRKEDIPEEWRKGLLVQLPKKGDTIYSITKLQGTTPAYVTLCLCVSHV